MATLVQTIIDQAAKVLQDETGVRWNPDELLGWVNESYGAIVLNRPDANPQTEFVSLADGTRQALPAGGTTLVTVTRNENGQSVRYLDRSVLDDQMPGWHAEPGQETVESFVYDMNNPKVFYVYPPAKGSRVELVYSKVPDKHTDTAGEIRFDDRFSSAILDYVLYRAYLKDADYAANDQRAVAAYTTFLTSLGVQGATPASQP